MEVVTLRRLSASDSLNELTAMRHRAFSRLAQMQESISAAIVPPPRHRPAGQGFMLPITIDAGMVTSLRRAVIGACGEMLTFLRVQPIAHSNKAKVWLCLALSAVDLATDAIMRTVPAAEFGRIAPV
jgi:hypothetical protein